MKVLYIGSERSDAQAVAAALRCLDQTVSVLWASHLERVVRWLDQNQDLAVLIVEAPVGRGSWSSALTQVLSRASRPAVVAILPDRADTPSDARYPGADDYVRRSPSLFRDLPIVVTRAIERAARVGLEQRLAQATTTLQDAEQQHQAASAAAADRLAERQAQYDVSMARAAAQWEMVDEQLRTAALEVEQARQRQAAAAADAARLSNRESELTAELEEQRREFRSQLAQEAGQRRDIEAQLARAASEREDAEQRHASEMRAGAAELHELEATLAIVRQQLESKTADLDRLTSREASLTSDLADLATSRTDLERRMAATEAAFDEAAKRGTFDRLAASKKAADREAELDGQLQHERTTRATLERTIADTGATLEQVRREHQSAAADVERLTHREAALVAREAELGNQLQFERETRAILEATIAETEAVLEQARRDHASAMADVTSAAADVGRLTQREAELTSQLDHMQAARPALERAIKAAEAALRDAEQRHEAALAAAATDRAERQTQFDRELSKIAGDRDGLKASVVALTADAVALRGDVVSLRADVTRLTQREADLIAREAELNTQLAAVQEARAALEHAVAEGHAALRDAEQRHEAARAAAANDLAEHRVQFDQQLAHIARERDGLTADVAGLKATVVSLRADVARLTQREANLITREKELRADIQQASATRASLEQAIAAGEAALRDAQRQHEAALKAAEIGAATELAERQAQFDQELARIAGERDGLIANVNGLKADGASLRSDVARLTQHEADLIAQEAELRAEIQQAAVARASLEQAIADGDAAVRDAQRQHKSALKAAATAASTELAERQTQFNQELTRIAGERDGLKADIVTLRADGVSLRADVARLTQREADLIAQEAKLRAEIQQAAVTRASLEQAIADGEAAVRDAQRQHKSALKAAETAAATTLAERQAQFDQELARIAGERDGLTADVVSLRTDIANLTQREANLIAQQAELRAEIQQAAVTRASLEQAIADGDAALRDAQQQHESALKAAVTAAATTLAERQAQFDQELARVAGERDGLMADVVSLRTDIANLTQREANLIAQQAELRAEIQQAAVTRTSLEQAIAEGEAALRDAQQQHEVALDAAATRASTELAERQAQFDQELARMAGERDGLTADVVSLRADVVSLRADVARLTQREADLIAQEAELQAELQQAGLTRSSLEQAIAEGDAALRDAQQRHDAALTAAATAAGAELAERQAQFDREFTRMAEEREALTMDVERLALRETDLTSELGDVSTRSQQLQEALAAGVVALEASRAESHRLFDHAGVAMFRCTSDGALVDVNRACTTIIGRRLDEFSGVDFAAAVFEAPRLLPWLIERCASTRVKESIETTWRRKDGSRLFIRLSARPMTGDVIEFVAEDLTRIRVLEERLAQAQRMEAVGRLASEIAVTCGKLLSDIHQKGREWLVTSTGNPDSRQHGERLFHEVGRAAGFLQQLAAAATGDEQARTPMLVDLNTLIRDLEPVLKRVAGGDVEVQLRDTPSPLNVDVTTERLERLLVNLASYGRGRMPFGGRLSIELGTSVVDRHFAAKHPSVRLGLHALITVTETRRTTRDEGEQRDSTATAKRRAPAAPQPGVDFSTLQELVSECGGHLWMKVQPLGDMIAKIRLPLQSSLDKTPPRSSAVRTARERVAARLFQT
jgi:PAS domain S-box-containing protein